jgi:phosphoglycerate dehydrogenase-like enzyme
MKLRTLLAGVLIWLASSSVTLADSAIEKLIAETRVKEGPVAVRDMPGWETPDKILVRERALGLVDSLQQAFPEVEFVAVPTRVEAIRHAAGADAIIGSCTEDVLDAAVDAIWVQVHWAGVEGLTNMQKMSSPVLAEHAVTMVMSLARGLIFQSKAMASGKWQDRRSVTVHMQSLSGKTLLVVGLGGIGTEVAKRAAALGMRVVATRRSSRAGPDYVDYVGLSDELYELAASADFIVNTLPLTSETTGIFDTEFFATAKKGAYFVSIGRLESGQIAGAGLDVTDPEPLPPDHRLWQLENVIITPHVGGAGGSRERHRQLLLENIRRFIAGDALLNVVDPQRGY